MDTSSHEGTRITILNKSLSVHVPLYQLVPVYNNAIGAVAYNEPTIYVNTTNVTIGPLLRQQVRSLQETQRELKELTSKLQPLEKLQKDSRW
jgi:hypothetical protein